MQNITMPSIYCQDTGYDTVLSPARILRIDFKYNDSKFLDRDIESFAFSRQQNWLAPERERIFKSE